MKTAGLLSGLLAAALLAATGATAQAPDCTGISGVFNTSPDFVGELTTVRVASGLTSPIFATYAPGDNERLFIVEQGGLIKILKNDVVLATPFLDLAAESSCCGERGLLGLAFHPDYQNPTNRYLFVYYTANGGAVTVERYQRNAVNPDIADEVTATLVKSIPHADFGNHNGGTLAFSPADGHLYFAPGDGGDACDPGPPPGNAQSLSSDLGKMHRLSVDTLPATTAGNPFDGATPGNDSIWSYGLRNPYRFSFDRITGAVYIGDVGQGVFEEIDCRPSTSAGGENYGWVNLEGSDCEPAGCPDENPSCSPPGYVGPIREYQQAGASLCAVVGGYVYRGCRMGDLEGTYFYSDNCSGMSHNFIKTFRTGASCSVTADIEREPDLVPAGFTIDNVVSFGEDNRGEMYIVERSGATGEVYKILPELNIMELSGVNAEPLMMSATDWSFEDLHATSGHAITTYRVYRSDAGSGPFKCKKALATNSWVGGDTDTPASGAAFYYVVAARSGSEETSLGFGSLGTPRPITPGLCQ